MAQNPQKLSMNGYKAFAFASKISNCPKFVTSGQLGDKIYQISKKLAPEGIKITKSSTVFRISFLNATKSTKVKYEWI